MKRRTKVILVSAAMMLALSIAFVFGVLQEQPWKIGDKEASGLFYYWHPGIKWTPTVLKARQEFLMDVFKKNWSL